VNRRSRFTAPGRLFLVLLAALAIEGQARVAEVLSRHLPAEPIVRRSDLLREQTKEIALMLDTTRAIRDALDPELGWRYKAGYSTSTDHLNAQGLRALHVYDSLPRPGVLRVAVFGDSFAYGNEVEDDNTWCSIVESTTNDIEVLNYGVGGYGLDQAFLRFQREGMKLRPDVVIIVFVPDDPPRVLNVYRRFMSAREWPLSKPRFALQRDGTLQLIPNPLPSRDALVELMRHPEEVRSLGSRDAWYSPTVYENPLYDHLATVRVASTVWRWFDRGFLDPNRLIRNGVFNEQSPAFPLEVAIITRFAAVVRGRGVTPIILLLPDKRSVKSVHDGNETVYEPLRSTLVRRGLTVWDGIDAFRSTEMSVDRLFAPYLHYSALGNGVLAQWLRQKLEPLGDARRTSWRSAMRATQSSGG